MNVRLRKTIIRTLNQYTPEYMTRDRKPQGIREWFARLFGTRLFERVPLIEFPEATASCAVHVPRKGDVKIKNLAVWTKIISPEDMDKCYPAEHGWHSVHFYQVDRARTYFIDGEAVS